MNYDVAIVGLGIVGASAVYAAAWAGARVLAFDSAAPGSGTSGASFAWLNSVRKEPEAYHHLNAAGMTAHRDLSRELGGDAGYHDGGSLEWADGGNAEVELRERVHRLASRGYPAEWISRERAVELEPGLAIPESVRDVAFFAADAWLDAPRLIGRLLTAASARGADVRDGKAVRSLRTRGARARRRRGHRAVGAPLRRPGHAGVSRAAGRCDPGRPRARAAGRHLPSGDGTRPGRARARNPSPARRRAGSCSAPRRSTHSRRTGAHPRPS